MSKRKTEHHARVGVIGGSGYIGAELLRYLSVHPRVELCFVTANTKAGESVSAVLPNLRGFVDDCFVPLDDGLARIESGSEADGAVDAVFLALPHTKSQDVVPQLAAQRPDLCIIDMAGDFRTPDPAGYTAFYGEEHRAPEWLDRFVYGITEFQRPLLRPPAFWRRNASSICAPLPSDHHVEATLFPACKHPLGLGDRMVQAIAGIVWRE